jgi:hypothetical protein
MQNNPISSDEDIMDVMHKMQSIDRLNDIKYINRIRVMSTSAENRAYSFQILNTKGAVIMNQTIGPGAFLTWQHIRENIIVFDKDDFPVVKAEAGLQYEVELGSLGVLTERGFSFR